jgi:hypothetical protein
MTTYLMTVNSYSAAGRSTQIITVYDEVGTPVANQFLPEDDLVANVVLQERCPNHVVEHLLLAAYPLVLNWIRNALLRPGPADRSASMDCAALP